MSTFQLIVNGWILLGILIFPLLLRVTAPYGRHTTSGWGPMIGNKLGWVIMELPALLVFPLFFLLGDAHQSPVTWVFFALWVAHYINRTILFPLQTRTKGKQMPLFIAIAAIFFNVMNGYVNGYYLGSLAPYYDLSWFYDPRFIIGAILFLTGAFINWKSDEILIHLRKPGETGYKIPYGGLFRYISCPNHFGEIVEWTGFAVMAWNLPAFSFALWTAVNLIPRALDHHKWYRSHFADYPKERKAVIPFIL